MRIVLVHNFYGSSGPSGENRVVEEEHELLRRAGHEVIEHFVSSDSVRDRGLPVLIRTGLSVPWNPRPYRALRRRIREVDPDVVHVHNVFPLLSPAIFAAARGARTATVVTLHNYRTVCPAAIPLRNGKACTECIDTRSVWPSMRYGCYRGSRAATAPLAAGVALHRLLGTYVQHVDAIIALSQFQKSVLETGGLPADRIHVKPNCYAGSAEAVPWELRQDKAVFIGRLSFEKGLHILLEAWNRWGADTPMLEVIGDGPDRGRLQGLLSTPMADRVTFLGYRTTKEALNLLSTAKMVIIPSISFECFPLVLREAIAFGVPVVASNLGVFPEVVEAGGIGRLFCPGDPVHLCHVAAGMWADTQSLRAMGRAGVTLLRKRYDRRANLAALEAIYTAAAANKARRLLRRTPHETAPALHRSGTV